MTVEQILEARKNTHGDFRDNAFISQELKRTLRSAGPNYTKLDSDQREALDMIMHKIARILAGNHDFKDHWDDIAGYATLVAKEL